MLRKLLILVCGIGLISGGVIRARHDEKGHESVRLLAARDIVEKLDEKLSKGAISNRFPRSGKWCH